MSLNTVSVKRQPSSTVRRLTVGLYAVNLTSHLSRTSSQLLQTFHHVL